MNITLINSSVQNYDYGLNMILQLVKEILTELGDNVTEITLSNINMPPLQSDLPNGDFVGILNEIQQSDGVIFAYNTHFSAPNSIMQNFLDYLSLPMCNNLLQDKNCYLLTTSSSNGEDKSLSYLSNVVTSLGGYPSITTGINKDMVQNISMSHEYKVMLEKQIEDFYRYVRQSRKFFVSSNIINNSSINNTVNNSNSYNYNQNNVATQSNQQQMQQQNNSYNQQQSFAQEPKQNTNPFPPQNKKMQNLANSYAQNNKPKSSNNVNDISNLNKLVNNNTNNNSHNTSNYNNQNVNAQPMQQQGFQENNIYQNQQNNQVSQPMQQNNNMDHNPNVVNAVRAESYFTQDFNNEPNQNVVPKSKTVEQMTKALEHYYQGHLANGFTMDLFIQVTGEESFEGTLKIKGNDCIYVSGQNNIADVTVISTTNVWKDILSGKISMQKAFMTGQVKVRGNFVLLSRFDNLFKF